MSSIEATGITLTIECRLAESTQPSQSKEMNEIIQTLAEQRMQISKLTEECSFVRDLQICLLSPSNFTNQSAYDRLINKFGTLSEVQKDVDKWSAYVTKINHIGQLLKIEESLLKLFKGIIDSEYINKKKQFVSEYEDAIKSINTLFDKMAIEFNLIAEDWKDVQEAFEKKNFSFSQNFVDRCQRVAQKALAA